MTITRRWRIAAEEDWPYLVAFLAGFVAFPIILVIVALATTPSDEPSHEHWITHD